jgi:hypothetical protein
MSLSQKFKEPLSGVIVSFSELGQETRYQVMQARRVETQHGLRVLMTLLEEDGDVISVFLPKRYGDAILDSDIADINTKLLQYYLTYKGKSSVSQAVIVEIEL